MFNKKVVFIVGLAIGGTMGAAMWYRYANQPEPGLLARIGLKRPETLKDRAVKDLSHASHVAQERFAGLQEMGKETMEKGRERTAEMIDQAKANINETMDHELEMIAKRWPNRNSQ